MDSNIRSTSHRTKAPSAELKENQTDQDTLPDYPILDAILVGYIENNLTIDEVVEEGFDREVVSHVVQLIKRNEYKRRH